MALVLLSLFSLASDTRASLLAGGVRTTVSLIAHPFRVALDSVQRAAEYTTGLFLNYHAAHSEVAELKKKLTDAEMRTAERAEMRAENLRLRRMLAFERAETRLAATPAKVISRRLDGTLIIDRGSLHGLEEGMGIITPDGVVGVVARVDLINSTVFTLNHPQCKLYATLEGSRVSGLVQGSGNLISEVCSLVYIDMKDEVRKGDRVVTSGGSHFPRGYPVGVVESENEGALLKAALVKPAADPFNAEEVFVVRRAQPAAEDLAGPPRDTSSAAPAMPDNRSEQEKYAP